MANQTFLTVASLPGTSLISEAQPKLVEARQCNREFKITFRVPRSAKTYSSQARMHAAGTQLQMQAMFLLHINAGALLKSRCTTSALPSHVAKISAILPCLSCTFGTSAVLEPLLHSLGLAHLHSQHEGRLVAHAGIHRHTGMYAGAETHRHADMHAGTGHMHTHAHGCTHPRMQR